MFDFFHAASKSGVNGHGEHLRKFKLLGDQETGIAGRELAQRAIQNGDVLEAASIVSQVLKNMQGLVLYLRETLQRAESQAEHARDLETCREAEQSLKQVIRSLLQPRNEAVAAQNFVSELNSLVRDIPEQRALLTLEVQQHCQECEKDADSLLRDLQEKQETITDGIERIETILSERCTSVV